MDTKLTYFFRRLEAPRLDPPCYGIECHLVIILAAKSVCTPPLVYTHPRHRVVPDSSAVAAFLSLLEHPRGSYSIFTSVYFFTCALDRCDVLHIYKLIYITLGQTLSELSSSTPRSLRSVTLVVAVEYKRCIPTHPDPPTQS